MISTLFPYFLLQWSIPTPLFKFIFLNYSYYITLHNMQITTILFRLAGKQIPPTVITEVHHLSELSQTDEMD